MLHKVTCTHYMNQPLSHCYCKSKPVISGHWWKSQKLEDRENNLLYGTLQAAGSASRLWLRNLTDIYLLNVHPWIKYPDVGYSIFSRAGTINQLIDNHIGTAHARRTVPCIANEAVILLHWHFHTPLLVGTKVKVVVTVHLNMGVASGYTHLITSGD